MSARLDSAFGLQTTPDLDFRVENAGALEYAAAPTLCFGLRVTSAGGEEIRSVQLNAQIRIAAPQRSYDALSQRRLVDLFGEPGRWGTTLKSLFWTQAALTVPAFTGETRVDLPVACTYDFEVAAAKYFHGVEDGEVPLEFLFSGTVFYTDAGGALRVGHISWEKEARFGLPVSVWKEMMAHYFPNSAWLRLHKDSFDRLYDFKARHALPTWEAALDLLLGAAEEEGEG